MYFQTDDMPEYPHPNPKPLLRLISPSGAVIFNKVQSHELRSYYKNNHAPAGCNGKRIWREKLIELGYQVIKVY